MRIVTRAEWKARSPKSSPTKVSIGSRTATCTHHDGPNPIFVTTFAQACALMRRDQNYHMDSNGWADIGYNYLVINAPTSPAVDGLIFEGRGRDAVGAHCANHNTEWIGIQVALGGGQSPSVAAKASVRWLHDTCATAANRQLAKKVHSDGFPTACPDPKLRAWVKAGMPVTTTTEVDMPLTPAEKQDIADLVVHDVLVAKLGRSDTTVAQALQGVTGLHNAAPIDVTALAKALIAAWPAGATSITPADATVIAKAVNDDFARRQVS